ncbi:hypothetical protein AVEN_211726-1, partial [Araneus ventricosus]
MRSCRISKQVLAPLVDTVMVPISDDGSYPGKMEDRHMCRSQWGLLCGDHSAHEVMA